jgi:hypothetical protein
MVMLLWGPAVDPPLQAVYRDLTRMGLPVFFLDQQSVLDTQMHWTATTDIKGWIQTKGQWLDLAQVTGVYLRPYDFRQHAAIAQAGSNSPEWHHALALENALLDWAAITPAFVLNRPSAMEISRSKPYQAEQIRRSGFRVPETLITNHPQAAQAFWQLHGDVIYKSISDVYSPTSRLKPEHSARLDDLTWCPTQFQQYISGQDYQVHVVGDHVFACEGSANFEDYRYAAERCDSPTLRAGYLPFNIQQRCKDLAFSLNLSLAGIDLRRSPQDEWYCFDVNPSPDFTGCQDATGYPISWAIAELFAIRAKSVAPLLVAL